MPSDVVALGFLSETISDTYFYEQNNFTAGNISPV